MHLNSTRAWIMLYTIPMTVIKQRSDEQIASLTPEIQLKFQTFKILQGFNLSHYTSRSWTREGWKHKQCSDRYKSEDSRNATENGEDGRLLKTNYFKYMF